MQGEIGNKKENNQNRTLKLSHHLVTIHLQSFLQQSCSHYIEVCNHYLPIIVKITVYLLRGKFKNQDGNINNMHA